MAARIDRPPPDAADGWQTLAAEHHAWAVRMALAFVRRLDRRYGRPGERPPDDDEAESAAGAAICAAARRYDPARHGDDFRRFAWGAVRNYAWKGAVARRAREAPLRRTLGPEHDRPAPHDPLAAVDARIDAPAVLAGLPPAAAAVAWAVHAEEQTHDAAGAAHGYGRQWATKQCRIARQAAGRLAS